MPKKNSNYWKQRFDQVEQAANNKSVKYTKQLEKKYKTAAQQIDEQINSWYQRIAQNNEVSITEARRLLSASELKEFKWTVEEYIKYGQENAIDQSWMKELENASAKFHINRLEALKLEARQQVEQLFAGGQGSMYDTLADIYKDSFYRSCFEIQKGVGVGFDVSALDDKQVSKLLMKPWSVDGTNFSEKLWGNKRKLINNLDQELSRMVLTGESPQRAIANIRKAMDSSQFAAKRLVLTEQAYFTTVAQKDAFSELDVEEYEIVATLDSRTSDICQKMDGQHFPVKDMTPGVNAPPFHVFCRTTTCPYFNDEFTVDDKRIAKGDDGEYYEVPANMTYPEWKKSFVDGDKTGLQEIKPDDIMKVEEPVVESVIEPEPVKELKPISDFRTPESKDYTRLIHGSQGAVPLEDKMQIHNHQKPDGSGGGYVATTNYSTINSNLRGDGYTGNQLDDDDMKTIEALRTAIQQYELDDDFVMTRYVNGDYLSSVFGIKTKMWSKGELENISDSITRISNPYVVKEAIPNITKELQEHIGETITEKAFVSFSIIPNKNIMKNKSVKINILARKGTHCYIPNNRKESEGIFADGSSYLLRDVQWDDTERKWILTMEIE